MRLLSILLGRHFLFDIAVFVSDGSWVNMGHPHGLFHWQALCKRWIWLLGVRWWLIIHYVRFTYVLRCKEVSLWQVCIFVRLWAALVVLLWHSIAHSMMLWMVVVRWASGGIFCSFHRYLGGILTLLVTHFKVRRILLFVLTFACKWRSCGEQTAL